MMAARTKHPALSVFAVAAAAVLALSACSEQAPTSSDKEGPLTKYFGALYDENAWNEDTLAEQQQREQDIIAKCMHEQGFEYHPNLHSVISYQSDDSAPEYGSKEFAELYGYGIVESPYSNTEGEAVPDPNEAYVLSLSESERQAYYEALSGPQLSEEQALEMAESGGGEGPDFGSMGCSGKAYEEQAMAATAGIGAAAQDPEFADLFKALNEMGQNYNTANPEGKKLDKQWAQCMAKAAYTEFESPTTVTQSLYDEWDTLQNSGASAGGESGEEPLQPPALSDADKAKFAKREKDIALADAKCRETTDYQAKQQEILFKVEQEFVDKHKKQLDALTAKYAIKKDSPKKNGN